MAATDRKYFTHILLVIIIVISSISIFTNISLTSLQPRSHYKNHQQMRINYCRNWSRNYVPETKLVPFHLSSAYLLSSIVWGIQREKRFCQSFHIWNPYWICLQHICPTSRLHSQGYSEKKDFANLSLFEIAPLPCWIYQ